MCFESCKHGSEGGAGCSSDGCLRTYPTVTTSVAIPNQVLMFTGGTSPALTKLNTGPTALIWQPVAADDMQGRVLARIIGEELGKGAKVNVAARNDA